MPVVTAAPTVPDSADGPGSGVRPAWTQPGWFDAEVRPDVAALIRLPLGYELIDALRAIGPVGSRCPHPHEGSWVDGDPIGVPGNPCACQVIVPAAWAAAASWTAQVATDRLLDAAGALPTTVHVIPERGRNLSITDPAVEDLAAAQRMAPGSLRNRLATARSHAHLPILADAVRDGTLAGWPAALIAQDTAHLPPDQQHLVIELLLAAIRDRHSHGLTAWTLPRIRQQAKTICARLDIDLQQARARAHAGRRVAYRSHGCAPGMAAIVADLPDDVAHRIWQRLTAITEALLTDHQHTGDDAPAADTRTQDQVRADVFTDLLLDNPAPATTTRVEATGEVAVVVTADTLLGGSDDPGWVPDLGPIPAALARELAADRTWRLWFTDPRTGHVTATSGRTYRPSPAVQRLIRARDPHCRMPGCRRPSGRCDGDHVINHPHGPSTPDNTGPLCRRHHNHKTHRGWHLTVTDTSTYTWTSPTGITHRDQPEPPLPDPPIDEW